LSLGEVLMVGGEGEGCKKTVSIRMKAQRGWATYLHGEFKKS